MASDAHAHPFYLAQSDGSAEEARLERGIVCAASAWSAGEFAWNAALQRRALCFGVHPQLCALKPQAVAASLETLHALVQAGKLDAVGECGFDLYGPVHKQTEDAQERLFAEHLELALGRGLPLVLHVRRAMHKVFANRRALKKARAVVLHSYSGTLDEAACLLRSGVNAFFSFGSNLLHHHKKALAACAALETGRLLFETDAPYQPISGSFSTYTDLIPVIAAAAALRSLPASELEAASDRTFASVFF